MRAWNLKHLFLSKILKKRYVHHSFLVKRYAKTLVSRGYESTVIRSINYFSHEWSTDKICYNERLKSLDSWWVHIRKLNHFLTWIKNVVVHKRSSGGLHRTGNIKPLGLCSKGRIASNQLSLKVTICCP